MTADSTSRVPAHEQRATRRAADLPGPRGLPLLGNALQIDSARFHQQLEAWSQAHGPFFKLRIGKRLIVVVGDHRAVTAVLRDRPDGFSRTAQLERVWTEMGLPAGVFIAHGETWRRQRLMVMAGFDPARVKAYYPALLAVAQRLAGRWQRAVQHGSAIDLQPDLMRYTVDAIAGLAFGAEVNTLESDDDVIQRHLNRILPALFKRFLAPLPTWRWVRTAASRELEHSVGEVKRAVLGFIEQARSRLQADPARRAQPPNLLEAMLVAADQPGSGIDEQQVLGNVLTMLLAGEDTTANTLAWAIHLLWQHPQALRRATEESRRVVPDGTQPTMEQIGQLDYLEACLHETMRLKPVAPIVPQQALRDVTFGDVEIPAGTVVINLMRRDSVSDSHTPRAAAFEPERWLAAGEGEPAASTVKRTSMPFGAGPRICPGRYLALMEMKVVLATLFTRFDIESVHTPDGLEPREHLALTMAPVGLQMHLRARLASAPG